MSVVIEYYGATWCKVCNDVKPGMKKLTSDFGVEFTEYDIDELEGEERVADIKKIPTVRIYKDTILVETIITKHIESVKDSLSKIKTVVLTDDF